MAGKYLRGALIEFTESFPLPIPNVIIFQYNPETMTHTWTPATTSPGTPGQQASNPLAITGDPQESFSFTLAMDASDIIADGDAVETALATASGIYSRLAALEMLLFPTAPPGGGLVGTISAALGLGGSPPGPTRKIPAAQLPTVLFIWGPGRIVPVRVASLSITERLYDADLLNPTHAEAQIGLRVLTQQELQFVDGPLGTLANTAAGYMTTLRQALALANLANAAESIIGMLPV
jgi:hypothetical protein